ncbi:MAG TPA: ATP-binding protein, partial [Duganella sp.]
MASERALKLGVTASVLALMALAVAADALAATPSPRRVVLCALLGLVPLCTLWQCLRKLGPRMPRMERQRGKSGGRSDDVAADGTRQNALAATVLALEARLEHAPIALFRIQNAGGAGQVAPLNASARRLLAPGRASAPHELHQLLAAQPVGQRRLVSFDTERGGERALVAISALSVQGSAQRLAALMPVESELEAEALNAWRELVQVLTHEIMNS